VEKRALVFRLLLLLLLPLYSRNLGTWSSFVRHEQSECCVGH